MGGAAVAMGVVQLGASIYEGEQQKKAAEQAAENTRLAAEADVAKINAELDDALSMQQVLFGGQGRVVEGSAEAVMEGDKAAAARDVKAVRSGAERVGSAQREAGRIAKFSSVTGGLLSAGSTYMKYGQVK